jgi:GNAT superfamily N-acetyltransferase
MQVTLARQEDFASVAAIDGPQAAQRAESLRQRIAAGECWITRIDGIAVGFAVLTSSFFGQPFIELLVVSPAHRRRGVATALVCHLETLARARSVKLFTSTNQSNAAMHALCGAIGFVRSGVIDNLDDGDPEIIYFKRL